MFSDKEIKNLDLLEPHNLVPTGVFTLDGLTRYGEEHKQCPYFSARRMVCFIPLFVLCLEDMLLTSVRTLDALVQYHHLLVPLPSRPENCRTSLPRAVKGLYRGLR